MRITKQKFVKRFKSCLFIRNTFEKRKIKECILTHFKILSKHSEPYFGASFILSFYSVKGKWPNKARVKFNLL